MPEVITLRLDPQTQALLNEFGLTSPESVQAVFNAALQQYLFSARFKEAQRRLSRPADGTPIVTEDDILDLPRASVS